jgi:hypothetical protein
MHRVSHIMLMRCGWVGGEVAKEKSEEVRDSKWANEGKPEFECETQIGLLQELIAIELAS